MRYSTYVRGMLSGMIGGMAGTLMMSLLGAGIFVALGWPTNTSFSIIGDSAAAFFSNLGILLRGGESLGVRLYCLIGLILGALFGVAVIRLESLSQASLKKKVGLSILYVEIMSIPLLAAAVLALKMSPTGAILWFCISFVMHLVYGLVLGIVTSLGVTGLRRYSPAVSSNTTRNTTPNGSLRP